MLAIKIWNYFRGYVIIRIEGLSLERLLNLALANDIYLWNIKRLNNLEIEGSLSISGFRSLQDIIDRLGCKVLIKEEKGIPFLINRLKKRKMLGFGIMIFLITIIFLSQHIWEIEIIGAIQTPEEKIISILDENNIRLGKQKRNIDNDHIKKILFNEFDYLSFLDVKTKGIKLVIDIKEQDIPLELVDKDYPAHIVAKNKGVIVKIVAKNGTAMVEKGQIVNKDQILISGFVTGISTEISYLVHSEGEVLAQTSYFADVEEPIVKIDSRETGKVIKQKGLKINNKGIKFIMGDIDFEHYDEEIIEKKLINFKWPKFDFPIKLVDYIYREVKQIEIRQDLDSLKKYSQLKAINEINNDLPDGAEIISKNVSHLVVDNILKTRVTIETIEDIGKSMTIQN